MSSCNLQHAEGRNLLAALGRLGQAGTGWGKAKSENLSSKNKNIEHFCEEIKDNVNLIKENLSDH